MSGSHEPLNLSLLPCRFASISPFPRNVFESPVSCVKAMLSKRFSVSSMIEWGGSSKKTDMRNP